jgi:hypothetical protein
MEMSNGRGVKYGNKKYKPKEPKDMRGNFDKLRSEAGWLCKCETCGDIGYVEIGVPVPTQCQKCFDESVGP